MRLNERYRRYARGEVRFPPKTCDPHWRTVRVAIFTRRSKIYFMTTILRWRIVVNIVRKLRFGRMQVTPTSNRKIVNLRKIIGFFLSLTVNYSIVRGHTPAKWKSRKNPLVSRQ